MTLTPTEFKQKVEYEGGVYYAIEYGLRSTELEDQTSELATKWAWATRVHASLGPLISDLENLLEDIPND